MCQECREEDSVIEEKTALLARWKARLEAAGKGFPTDVDLLDLMDRAAELRDEPGCICRSRLYTLTVDGAPFMTLCGCQLEGLRQYAVSRKAP
jgi:hypothetical protein